MTAADAVIQFLTPLLAGWRIQFGRWVGESRTDRYAVLRPAGGLPAELVRQPQFTLSLIGAVDESTATGQAAADAVIEAMRSGSGDLVFLQPGEPAFQSTSDGRPIFEIAISAITN